MIQYRSHYFKSFEVTTSWRYWMLDLNKPIRTRDGRKVRILCTDKKGKYSIVALVLAANGDEMLIAVNSKGSYLGFNLEIEHDSDLVNYIPELTDAQRLAGIKKYCLDRGKTQWSIGALTGWSDATHGSWLASLDAAILELGGVE